MKISNKEKRASSAIAQSTEKARQLIDYWQLRALTAEVHVAKLQGSCCKNERKKDDDKN